MNRRLLAVTVLLSALALILTFTGLHLNHPETQRGIHIFLTPHPDDELQGWSSLTNDPSIYTVFVASTRGESTRNCDPDIDAAHPGRPQVRPDLGEDPLPISPPPGRRTPGCGQARITSWNRFLDAAAAFSSSASLGEGTKIREFDMQIAGADAHAWVGSAGARVSLNLGDGHLQTPRVVAAVRELLGTRGKILPNLPVTMITCAGY